MAFSQKDHSLTWVYVLITGVATTLALWVSLTDPVNIPKMFVLSLFSAGILGSVIPKLVLKPRSFLSMGQIAILVFAFAIFLAAILSDERYTAFYGARGRNNGAISYLALASLSFVAMQSFRLKTILKLRSVMIVIGAFLAFYGNLQISHHDPIKWNLIYNPIVGTLGNPDFVSAELGICVIATLWWILEDGRMGARLSGALLILFEIFIIRRSGSMQGLLIVAVGSAILLVFVLWNWKKVFGLIGMAVFLFASLPVLLGLMNKGPFAAHIYRGSIQSRLDYWHAALSMFRAQPLIGIGLDRLGENYWQYAPQVQIAVGQSTDNAHNVFLQLLATGGLLVFVPYVSLIVVIAVSAFRAISKIPGKGSLPLIGLSSMWISLLLISTISIDTLGVSVWFWIIGGALYSSTRRYSDDLDMVKSQTGGKPKKNGLQGKSEKRIPRFIGLTSGSLGVILAFVLVLPAWRSSLAIQDLTRNRNQLNTSQFTAKMMDISKMWPRNPQTLVLLSDLAMRIANPSLANEFANEAMQRDPRSYNAHLLTAISFETQGKFAEAISPRVELMKLQPWSPDNMLQLVKDYLQVGEREKARRVSAQLSRTMPKSDLATQAALLVKG